MRRVTLLHALPNDEPEADGESWERREVMIVCVKRWGVRASFLSPDTNAD
jgi:hypothetical protein